MSTRCQVKVSGSEVIDSNDVQMLYHHTDGYPSYMIKVLQKALKIALNQSCTVKYDHSDKHIYTVASLPWEAGRVGKAASAMCAADPLVMEPDANELHSDIQYLYRIYLVNPSGLGHTGEKVRWDFDICMPSSRANFWDEPTEANMVVVVPRQPLHKASGKKIEKALRG